MSTGRKATGNGFQNIKVGGQPAGELPTMWTCEFALNNLQAIAKMSHSRQNFLKLTKVKLA